LIWIALVAVVFVAGGSWLVAKTVQTRVIVFALGVASVATYWFVGHPDMSDHPLDARLAAAEKLVRTEPDKVDTRTAIAVVESKIRERPEDPTGYVIVGRMYESMAQNAQMQGAQLMQAGDQTGASKQAGIMQDSLQKAEDAFRDALRRDGSNVEVISDLADLRFKSTGDVDPETTQLYQIAFKAQPEHFRLGYLAGIGLWKEGKKDEAQALWDDIEKRAPAGGPERQMFAALRQMFGIDPPTTP
jgi:cytochrome c-type biogenesis protein CcmH/NrfG